MGATKLVMAMYAIGIGLIACNPDDPTRLLPGSLDVANPAVGGDSSAPLDARSLFKAMEPELLNACQHCHVVGGKADAPFLEPPDPYKSIKGWYGIVTADPNQSRLLTYASAGGGHSGPFLDGPNLVDTLYPKVVKWLEAEAKDLTDLPPEPRPHIEPRALYMGFNAFYLDEIDPSFKGMAVMFQARWLEATTLELTDITMYASSKLGVHVVHPVFVQYQVGKDPMPDPIDSFSNVDQNFEVGTHGALGPGTFVFSDFSTDATLGVAFDKIELYLPVSPDVGGCKDVVSFEVNARDHFFECTKCHDGTNSQAHAAVDMSALFIDSAKACAQIKNRVDPLDPPSSQIFITTDPLTLTNHEYKFKGDSAAFGMFRDAVSIWVAAEK